MQKINTLYVGFGDLAERVHRQLAVETSYCATAVVRSAKKAPHSLTMHIGNAKDPDILSRLSGQFFERVLITLTPQERSDSGYKQAYVDVLNTLLAQWQHRPPAHIAFVSSTSVYGQSAGEWVDEAALCEPQHFSGKRLVQAEQLLKSAGLRHTILRLAGIYGPGRDFLQQQVLQGKGGDSSYTNRIHVDDAARFIAGLISSDLTGPWTQPIFNVCDSLPAPSAEVRQWLAQNLKVNTPLHNTQSGRGGNKRCSNHLMLQTGFKLLYPSYKEGYTALLNQGPE